MTHWEYLDEPHYVIARELRMHELREERKRAGRVPPADVAARPPMAGTPVIT